MPMLALSRGRVLCVTLAAVSLVLVLTSFPVAAGGHTVTVTSHETGAVVEGQVSLQGAAEDPGNDLKEVTIAIEGSATLKKNVPGNQRSYYEWSINWNSQAVTDGWRTVTVTASTQAGPSEPVVLTLIVDNDKEPKLQTLGLWFDVEANGTYAPWDDFEVMPTTRLSFDLAFSEPMDEDSVREAVAFVGGASSWQLTPQGRDAFWVNVSYLDADTNYTFVLGEVATDLAGNPLTPNEVVFRTAAEPTPGTPEEPPEEPNDPGDPEGPGTGLDLGPLLSSPWLWIGSGAGVAAIGAAVAWRKGLFGRLKERLAGLRSQETESPWESPQDEE